MWDFQKLKIQFWKRLRVDHLKKSFENKSEDGIINVVQTFCGLKENESSTRLKVIQSVSNPVHSSITLKVILKRFRLYN